MRSCRRCSQSTARRHQGLPQCQPRDPAPPRSAGGCLRWDNGKTQAGVKNHGNGYSILWVRTFASPVCYSYTGIRVSDLTPLRNQLRVPLHRAWTPPCLMVLQQLVPGRCGHCPCSLPDGTGPVLAGRQLESLNFS